MTSTSAAAHAAHVFYADSKVARVPTPVSFAAPIELAIASTLDEALLLALGEVHYATDEDALDLGLRRALGDDVGGATLAAPAPVFMPEPLPPALVVVSPPATLAAPPSTDPESSAVMPAPTVVAAPASVVEPAFDVAVVEPVAAQPVVGAAVSARAEVLDQDLRAEGDEDEAACELQFFSQY